MGIPNTWTAEQFLNQLDTRGFKRKDNYVYLPRDFSTGMNFGYAFINFINASEARRFEQKFTGIRWPKKQPAQVVPARCQGQAANVAWYQNNPINNDVFLMDGVPMPVQEDFKPMIFDEQGNKVAFPKPTHPSPTMQVSVKPQFMWQVEG